MIYGYARVSTRGQARDGNSLEAQRESLHKAGAEIVFCDSHTGAKESRPELDKLLASIGNGDTLLVSKLDRIARSVAHGEMIISDLLSRDITVNILNMGVLDNTPIGKLARQIFFAFAEFERDIIFERTQEGKEIARQNPSFREGRPKKYGREQIRHALSLLENHSFKQVEELTGISKSTLIRARRSH